MTNPDEGLLELWRITKVIMLHADIQKTSRMFFKLIRINVCKSTAFYNFPVLEIFYKDK